jgi:hypothetical protein
MSPMNEFLHIIVWGLPGWVVALISIIYVTKWFWKNWLKTYAEENAKIATINQNFTNALEQLKETTREVSLIQNAISNQIWLEQWRMNQKRDIYVKMIEIIEQWTLERGKVRYHPEASRDRESDVINEFRKARAVARLMLEAELIDVAVHHVVRDVYPVDPRTATEGEYGLTRQRLREVRDGIVAAGRRELQFGASSATRVALQPSIL